MDSQDSRGSPDSTQQPGSSGISTAGRQVSGLDVLLRAQRATILADQFAGQLADDLAWAVGATVQPSSDCESGGGNGNREHCYQDGTSEHDDGSLSER